MKIFSTYNSQIHDPKIKESTLSNGIDWSPDGHTMYFIDSAKTVIDAYDYDVTDGSISNKRAVFDLSAHGREVSYKDLRLLMDGMNVDANGDLYVAYAGSGEVSILYTDCARL